MFRRIPGGPCRHGRREDDASRADTHVEAQPERLGTRVQFPAPPPSIPERTCSEARRPIRETGWACAFSRLQCGFAADLLSRAALPSGTRSPTIEGYPARFSPAGPLFSLFPRDSCRCVPNQRVVAGKGLAVVAPARVRLPSGVGGGPVRTSAAGRRRRRRGLALCQGETGEEGRFDDSLIRAMVRGLWHGLAPRDERA